MRATQLAVLISLSLILSASANDKHQSILLAANLSLLEHNCSIKVTEMGKSFIGVVAYRWGHEHLNAARRGALKASAEEIRIGKRIRSIEGLDPSLEPAPDNVRERFCIGSIIWMTRTGNIDAGFIKLSEPVSPATKNSD
ncbi:MAG: hypothetical protein AAF709_06540 [Pseudomonadota bacterium]